MWSLILSVSLVHDHYQVREKVEPYILSRCLRPCTFHSAAVSLLVVLLFLILSFSSFYGRLRDWHFPGIYCTSSHLLAVYSLHIVTTPLLKFLAILEVGGSSHLIFAYFPLQSSKQCLMNGYTEMKSHLPHVLIFSIICDFGR